MSTQQKQPDESWESFAERRIREAERDGAFERLPGLGEPIPGLDRPLDENWWVRDKLKREEINAVPPVLEMRLERERTLASLGEIRSEREVRRTLERLNQRIREAHFSHVPGPATGVLPVDVEREVERWRRRRSE